MVKKHLFIVLLFVIFGVLFALSSCGEAGTETPTSALSGFTLTYDVAVEVNTDVNSSPVWAPVLDKPGDVTYSVPENAPLPNGLTLDPKTGIITGSPTAVLDPTDYAVTATATRPGAYTGTVVGTASITILFSKDLANYDLTYDAVAASVGTSVNAPPKWEPALALPDDVTYIIAPDDPALPAGLTLTAETGVIEGKPTAEVAQKEYTITARGEGAYTGTVLGTISITLVTANDISGYTLSYNGGKDIQGDVGSPITEIAPSWEPVLDKPGDVTYSIAPSFDEATTRLHFDTATGSISGTSYVPLDQTYTITATAKDGGAYTGKTTGSVSIITTIPLSEDSLSYPPIAVAVNIDIPEAEGFAPTWTNTLAFPNDVRYTSTNLPEGLVLNQDSGVIWGRPTAVTEARYYTITVAPKDGAVYTGSVTFDISITVLAPNDISGFTLSYPNPADEIPNKIEGVVGRSLTVAPSWDTTIDYPANISYEIGVTPSLPEGLALNTGTGAIEGTPTKTKDRETYLITARGSGNYSGEKSVSVRITIFDPKDIAGPDYSLTYPLLTTMAGETVKVSPVWKPAGMETQVSYSVAPALPTGLSLNTEGEITGTPTEIKTGETYRITASAKNPGSYTGSRTASFTIIINKATLLKFRYPNNINVAVTTVINEGPAFTPVWDDTLKFPDDVTYSSSPNLPAGLNINPATGAISGTPTAVTAEQEYTVTAKGADMYTGTPFALIRITINPIDISTTTLKYNSITTTVGTKISDVAPSWGKVPAFPDDVTYSSPNLPAGLNINPATGAISGTPTAVTAEQEYTVTAKGSGKHGGELDSAPFSITITAIDISTYKFRYSIATGLPSNISTAPVWAGGTPEDLTVTYAVISAPDLPTDLALNSDSGLITGSFTNLRHARAYTVTASGTGNYEGSTTAVFVDTLLLEAYAPSTGDIAIGDRAGLEAMKDNPAGTYHLTNHIDLEASTWTPLFSTEDPFTGTLHGNGYAIYNLTIAGLNTDHYQGLFAALGDDTTGATVENLGIGVTQITGGAAIGALAGYAIGSTMNNITSAAMSDTATITANNVVAINFDSGSHVGGLVGYLNIGSTLTGNSIGVSVSGTNSNVGGLVGSNAGTTNGYATGSVTGESWVGGLAGDNNGTITGYATGSVSGGGNNVGGLAGSNEGTVSTVTGYATGSVSGGGNNVGGLAGSNEGTVTGYATGAVTGTGSNVGGLVGANDGTVTGYATGAVTGTTTNIAGLVGANGGTTTGYWDQESTGQTKATDDGSTGTLTGGVVSATLNIVYTAGPPSTYTDSGPQDSLSIFTDPVFTNFFALPKESATWPKLKSLFAIGEQIIDFTLPQPTVSDVDGDDNIDVVW